MHKKTKSDVGTIINNQNHKKQQYCRGRTLGDPKGITLIALVITIVILIILAGVAINLTLGENGIFNKAKYAVEQQKMAEVKERVELAIADIQTDKISKDEECTVDTIISELPGKISGLTISKDGDNAKGTYNGCDFTITPNLKVTIDGYNPSAGGSTGGGTGGNTPTTPPTPTTYSVTFNGTNVTSNGASSVDENATYTATLTASTGYKISSVTVTMDGTALVENIGYTYSSGNLSIPNINGNIVITATGEIIEITASNYGQYVNYGIDLDSNGNTTDDWQIFYKEEDTSSPNYGATYIIADYYVPVSKMTTSISSSKAGMTQYSGSTYRVYWNSVPTYQTISDTVKQVFMYDYTGTSNPDVCAVSTLLNPDNWKDNFVTAQLQAKGGLAIGGPTINMWCASWNKAYPTEKVTASIPDSGTGYQVNGSYSVDLSSYTGYTSAPNVYFPTKSADSDGTNYYLLASPSSCNSDDLVSVHCSGSVYRGNYNHITLGVRPLVYLPSSVTLEPTGTPNVWNINYGTSNN